VKKLMKTAVTLINEKSHTLGVVKLFAVTVVIALGEEHE
jgi:hypothetical protein